MNPKPGEVWLVDLGLVAKMRPVVIVSRYDPNPSRALVVYIPVTTQNRRSLYEVELLKLQFLTPGAVANLKGVGSIPRVRLEHKLGDLPEEVMLPILDFGFWIKKLLLLGTFKVPICSLLNRKW